MKKESNFFHHMLVLFTGSGINVIIGILTTPIITRLIEPDAYGKLSFFNMYSNLIYVFLMVGYDQALSRYYYEAKKRSRISNLIYNLLKLPIFLAILCDFLLFIFKDKILIFNNNPFIVFLLSCNILTLILFRFSTLVLRLEMDTKFYAVLNIMHKILYVALVLGFVKLIPGHNYEILAAATVFSLLIPSIIAIYIKKNIWNFSKENRKKYKNFRKITMYSLPFVFSSILSWGFEAVDKFSIKKFGTYADVGIYASASTIISIISVIATTFNTIWVPMAMDNYTKNPEDKGLYMKANSGIVVVMYFIGLNIILFKEFIVFLLGPNYREAVQILPCLIFYPIMFAISETTVNGINFSEKSQYHIVITLTSMVVNVVGNTVLVPLYGCAGAAMSTGFSCIIFWAIRTMISVKLYYVDYKINRFICITVIMYIYAVINSFYNNYIINIGGYFIILILLLLAYKNIVLEGIKSVHEVIKKRGTLI